MKKINLLIALLFCISTEVAFAQSRQITGTVLDETGVGLPGAGVGIQGTGSGTATDVDGKFQLDLPEGKNTIVVQATGYNAQTITVTGNTVTVRMTPTSQELEGAVVTANAIRREKRSLGYSTTQVTGNELTTGGSTSPLNALVGKTAGANITTTSNSPGSSSRIVLRGGSSLLGNNQALIVVDGVPINNSNFATNSNSNIGILSNQVDYGNRGNDINPEDIESISVLKGPAATAQYGSAGSNGAIMITTKKGRTSKGPTKTDIEVSSSYELSSILKYPEFQNKYGQGIVKGVVDDRRENFSWGLPFDGQNRPWGQVIDGQQRVKPYSAMEDNVKDFFDVGQTWNNNVAINGGAENAAFRLSLGAINGKLIYPGKKYNRYTIGFNGSAKLSNKFYSSIGFNYVKSNSDLPGSGQGGASILNNLYQQPRDIPITELANLDDKFNSMNYTDELGIDRYGYYGAYTSNPYYVLREYKNINKVDRIYGNYILGYQILSWLKLENRLAMDIYSDRRYQSQPVFSSEAADETGLYGGNDPQTSLGLYSEDVYNSTNIFNDLMLSATKDITKDLSFTGLLGHNVSSYRTDNLFASTNEEGGISVPGYYNLSNSKGAPFNVNTLDLRRKVGVYGDFGLGYKNYLFVNLTGRYDKSSTIKKGYFYYGANGSIVFSEFFSQDLKRAWNYGKLRLSFGSVGNDALAYQDRTYYQRTIANGNFGSTIFPLNGVPGFSYDNRLGNPNLQPEFTKEFEIGTEMSFWSNRATIDFSYYAKRSKNQIVPVSTAASSGFTTTVLNTGLVTNNGIELALRLTPVMLPSGFRWELFGTYTKNNNKVVDIYQGVNQIPIGGTTAAVVTATVGRPYGTFFMVGYDRTPDGRIIIDTATNTPRVSDTSLLFGTYLPKFQASWGTTINYRGFSLSLLFDMKKGGVFYSRTRDIMGFVGTSKETEDRTEKVWANSVVQTGDQQYVTNTRTYDPYDFFTTSGLRAESDNLVDASYVKLREARLTYLLPQRWFKKTFIGNASVSLYGNNLIIWTPDENKYVDPEVNSAGAGNTQGFDFTASPSLRNYGINVRLTF